MYSLGSSENVCEDMETGEVAWRQDDETSLHKVHGHFTLIGLVQYLSSNLFIFVSVL